MRVRYFSARSGASYLRTSKWIEGSYETMRDDETSHLPPGYSLDLVGDPCIIILRRPDRTVVTRFTDAADPREIRRAAEDAGVRGERRND
jgi:hypothetical protein